MPRDLTDVFNDPNTDDQSIFGGEEPQYQERDPEADRLCVTMTASTPFESTLTTATDHFLNINRQIEADLDGAVADWGGDLYYCRQGNDLVQIAPGGGQEAPTPVIQLATVDAVHKSLITRMDFVRVTAGAKGAVKIAHCEPPRTISRSLVAQAPRQLHDVHTVVTSPCVASDGTIISTPCVHDGIIALPPEGPMREINARSLDAMSLTKVRQLLCDELLGDFPWVEPGDMANAIALILAPLARRLIFGPVPLFALTAPGPGSGKTLLQSVCAIVSTGDWPTLAPMPLREEEVEKTLLSFLLAGRQAVCFDNVPDGRELNSPALAALLTSRHYSGRRLGRSEIAQLPNQTVWSITGSNTSLSAELLRRTVHIRINPDCERPEDRSGFRHANLMQWTIKHRCELIAAALKIVRAWVVSARPMAKIESSGSFESFAGVIGGMLQNAGIDGFSISRPQSQQDDTARIESEFRALILELWAAADASRMYYPRELMELAAKHHLLHEEMAAPTEMGQVVKFARALHRRKGRVFGDYTLIRDNRKFRLIRRSDSNGSEAAPEVAEPY